LVAGTDGDRCHRELVTSEQWVGVSSVNQLI
jgi:hypothetical protein